MTGPGERAAQSPMSGVVAAAGTEAAMAGTAHMAAGAAGPVDEVLDGLFDALAGTGGPGRRALAEAEDHLYAAAAEAQARGLDRTAAERDAVRRFGDPRRVAAGIRHAHLDLRSLLRQGFTGAWFIAAFSLVAVGVSGLVAEVLGRLFGAGFVAGDGPGVTYTADRCADYYEYFPGASSCGGAAALHHWGEVVESRVAAGVLGLAALGMLWLASRTVARFPAWRPPSAYVVAVLLALFGVASVALTGLAAIQLLSGQTSGVGANLSAGLVSVVVTLVLLGWSWRAVRRRSTT